MCGGKEENYETKQSFKRKEKVGKQTARRSTFTGYDTDDGQILRQYLQPGKSADGSKDAGVQTLAAVTGDGVRHDADPDTTQEYTLGDPDSTRYDGRVWVDKSVSKDKSVSFGGDKSVANNSDFLVTYSALATSTAVQGDTPVDVVFVLDLSASMCWGTRAQTVTSKEDSRIKAMVDALNENIAVLAEAGSENPYRRRGI